MKVLLTGGTGLIGRALCHRLANAGHELTVFSRRPESVARLCGVGVACMGSLDEYSPDRTFDAVINLAGEPIFDARWTENRKRRLWESRVKLTEDLVAKMLVSNMPPKVLLSGSAIGYYGNQGDLEVTEAVPAGTDFGAQLCEAWEQAALKARRPGVRVCLLRTGLVLTRKGGLLGRMVPAFQLGLGARLGDGRQWMSWIHIDDYINAVEWLLGQANAEGPFNMTAPQPVTNAVFTSALAKILRRPAVFGAPAWALRPLLGEMAELLLGSQRAKPNGLGALGYKFTHSELNAALAQLWASS